MSTACIGHGNRGTVVCNERSAYYLARPLSVTPWTLTFCLYLNGAETGQRHVGQQAYGPGERARTRVRRATGTSGIWVVQSRFEGR